MKKKASGKAELLNKNATPSIVVQAKLEYLDFDQVSKMVDRKMTNDVQVLV